MSGPSLGRQEAGAPCTGECLFPVAFLALHISLEQDRSNVCCPMGLHLLLTKGNLVSRG